MKKSILSAHPISWDIFVKTLHSFSKAKTNNTLTRNDIDDFKKSLLKNDINTVVDFIEKSVEINFSHPCAYLMNFEVLRALFVRGKVMKEKYSSLCKKLFEKRNDEIAEIYDTHRIKIILATAI